MIAYLIVSSFLISTLTLFFFIAVFVRGIRSDDGRKLAFGLFSSSIFVWSLGHMFWLLSDTAEQALFWLKVLVLGSIYVPYAYFHFSVSITSRDVLRPVVWIGYGVASLLALLNLGPFVVAGIEPRMGFPFWPIPGPGFPAYLAGFISLVLIGVGLLISKYRKSGAETKNQYKYIFLGTGIGFAGGATNFPLWLDIPVLPFGHVLVILYILGVGYSMVKYRILDFSEMAFRVLGILIVAILFSGLAAIGLVALLGAVYPGFYPSSFVFWWCVCLVITLFVLSLGASFFESFSTLLHELFLAHRYTYRTQLKALSEQAFLGADTEASIGGISRQLADVLSVDVIAFYIRSEVDFDYTCTGALGDRAWKPRVAGREISFLLELMGESPVSVQIDELFKESSEFKRAIGVVCGDGKVFHASDLVVPVAGHHEILGFLILGVRRDQTVYADLDFLLIENLCSQLGLALKLREVERIANQVDKLVSLGTMAAGLSHELRNPLVSIRTLSSLLARDSENLKLNKEFSQTVQRDVKRISGIIESVATFAQDSKRPTMPVDIEEVIREAWLALEETLEAKNIRIDYRMLTQVPAIRGNSEQLIQVFQNIIENAIHAITEWESRPEQGEIEVRVHLRESERVRVFKRWVEVEVADNGPGMAEAFRARVFDPFVTSRDTGMRSGAAGSGLGLAIVNKIIEHHQGHIVVSSELGQGACFKVSLPCA